MKWMKTERTRTPFFTSLLSIITLGLMGIIGIGSGCSDGGDGGGSIGSSQIQLNEVLFFASGNPEWAELYNSGSDPSDIALFEITNKEGDVYAIPEDLPMVPPGGYVVILFDGLGSDQNEYNFDKGYAVLHTDTLSGDVFDNISDICTLYSGNSRSSGSKIDFVAWGDYPHVGQYVFNMEALGTNGPVEENQSIGVHPDVYMIDARLNWVKFIDNETTPGRRNVVPAPILITPYDSSRIVSDKNFFVWHDSTLSREAFHLEVDNNNDFRSPELSLRTERTGYETQGPLPQGTHFWRVKTVTRYQEESHWSATFSFTMEPPGRSELVGTWDLGVTPVLVQHKDAWFLCPACNEFGDHSWDAPHSDDVSGIHGCDHCKVYCPRASLTMLNHFFGGDISQDFASWLMFGTHEPAANTLGHGMGASDILVSAGINLAFEEAPNVRHEPITFAKVIKHINAGRPLLAATKGHAVVVDGYHDYEDPADDQYHVVEPWTGKEFLMKANPPHPNECPLVAIWALPVGLHGVHQPDVYTDTDFDGVNDFDEERRFGTSPITDDSDGDFITDWTEIWAYAHGKGSAPRHPVNGWGIWNKKNYDGDAYDDGHEDLNRNGRLDPGECDPFVKDQPVKILLEIGGAHRGGVPVDINAIPVGNIPWTGDSPGYFDRIVDFLWCGTLEPGTDNRITITARTSRGDGGDTSSSRSDAYDDIMIKNIVIVDTKDNKWLLEDPGPYHLGNHTLAEIKKFIEDDKWNDPNGLAFWTELDGTRVSLNFSWH